MNRPVSVLVEFFESPHIQLALAAGASILTLAYASKRLLPEPMDYLAMAFPPFLAVIGEGVISQHGEKWYGKGWVWSLAILLATALVIGWYLI